MFVYNLEYPVAVFFFWTCSETFLLLLLFFDALVFQHLLNSTPWFSDQPYPRYKSYFA